MNQWIWMNLQFLKWQAANILLKFNVRMFNMTNQMLANVTDLLNLT